MAKLNRMELDELTPAERIRKLKEIETENKKEIAEAEKLIKQTENEIEKDNISESVKIPDAKPIDIDSLFQEPPSLETTVREEAAPTEIKEESQLYMLAQAYEEAKGMAYSDEPLNEEQMAWIDKLGERVEKASYHSFTTETADLLVATRSLVKKILKYQQQEGRLI
jgi:transcriptional regulator with XRE-family HTH domain